jgi:DNA-binding NarL/FixJ family response regulator
MKPTNRILLVDDHPFFSEGLMNALRTHPAYIVVNSVQTGDGVMHAVHMNEPDIIILDINLPGINGLELVPVLKEKYPQLKIMLLSMYMPADIRLDAKKQPIDAYVLKNSGTDILLTALEQITAGERFFDPNIQATNLHANDKFSRKLKLSSRELEILQLLKDGYSNKEISHKLFLSELTVKTHRKNIMTKMGARNIADLLRK